MYRRTFIFAVLLNCGKKIYAFGRFHRSPLKIPKGQIYERIITTHDCSGLKLRCLIKNCHIFARISHGFLGEKDGHFCKSSSLLNSQSENAKVGYCYKWARLTYFVTGNLGHMIISGIPYVRFSL